jgi:Fic family protein
MIIAWMDALERYDRDEKITPEVIRRWGALIEPDKNARGFRQTPVYVGFEPKMDWKLIDRAIEGLCEQINLRLINPLDAYREFELIHPFMDGNGRTGKIILNWVNNTLLDPTFPPKDFWGPVISNP